MENTLIDQGTTEQTGATETKESNGTNEVQTEQVQSNETKSLIDQDPEDVKVEGNHDKEADSKEADNAIEYTDFKLPEDYLLNDDIKKEFIQTAKELKLNQDQAQKFVDLQVKHVQDVVGKVQSEYQQTIENWKNETITTLGADYKKELSFVSKAVKKYGTPELKTLLNTTGLGNNKEIVMLLRAVGKEMADDKFIDGNKSSGEMSLAKRLYPTHN